ncbi:MAG TPA: hypothetical protein VIY28_05430 [Pseudonocardiaceae bacterium]
MGGYAEKDLEHQEPRRVAYPAGQPTVNGIRTETLTELVTAGEPMQFVADTYGLTLAEVEQAVSYQAR